MGAIVVRFILKPGNAPGEASVGETTAYTPSLRCEFIRNPLLLQELLSMEGTFVCAVF